ncbi:hypothetical protein H1R20_g6897, partial [Candolleomyces eurysporus]
MMLSLLTVVVGAAVHVYAAQFNIYHRVVQSTSSSVPFVQRGTLNLVGSNANLESVSTLSEDLARLTQNLNSEDVGGALYQVALQHPEDFSATEWAVSSVKLCHLSSSTAQTLHLYLSEEEKPYAINYFLSPVDHSGSCPRQVSKPEAERISQLNTTILLRRPSSPPSPELRTPPPLTPEGQVVQPVPEKSFFQKYWYYIAIFFFAIMLTSPPPEEGQQGGDRRQA